MNMLTTTTTKMAKSISGDDDDDKDKEDDKDYRTLKYCRTKVHVGWFTLKLVN
jgi:spermidine synthase